MKGDRFKCPVDQEYIVALGRATYTFAYLEWQVVWCMEKLRPGFIYSLKTKSKKLTAGMIAKKFKEAVRCMEKSDEREQLAFLANKFLGLVEVRNNIMHGKPCTSSRNQQRLSGREVIEVCDLEDAADEFIECNSQLNKLYYEFLDK
ncbi:hypothetical protein LCA30_21665 [Vibrio harveyi]|uniref:hypothetical protein n=1 Tax=Vibrio harveyi TaxID=669 RepID=UPI003BB48CA6